MLFRSHLNEIAVRKRLVLMECETKRWILKVQWDHFIGRFKTLAAPPCLFGDSGLIGSLWLQGFGGETVARTLHPEHQAPMAKGGIG